MEDVPVSIYCAIGGRLPLDGNLTCSQCDELLCRSCRERGEPNSIYVLVFERSFLFPFLSCEACLDRGLSFPHSILGNDPANRRRGCHLVVLDEDGVCKAESGP